MDRYLAEYSSANLKIAERGSLHDEADVLRLAPRNAHRVRCVFEGQPFPLADCAELEAELVTSGGIGATDPNPQFASLCVRRVDDGDERLSEGTQQCHVEEAGVFQSPFMLGIIWQWLFRYEDRDACSSPVVVAPAVQMREPEVGHERGSVLEDRAALYVGTLQRPHLAGDAVARVFGQWHRAPAVEPARNHGIRDGEDVVCDEAAAERARLAARRASDRGLEAADARVAHDVAVEALLNRWQADAPAYRAADAVHYPLPFR